MTSHAFFRDADMCAGPKADLCRGLIKCSIKPFCKQKSSCHGTPNCLFYPVTSSRSFQISHSCYVERKGCSRTLHLMSNLLCFCRNDTDSRLSNYLFWFSAYCHVKHHASPSTIMTVYPARAGDETQAVTWILGVAMC